MIFDDHDITRLPMYKRARLGIGYLSQEPSIFQRLSVRDNLLAILETMSLTRKERKRKADTLIEQFGLHGGGEEPRPVPLRRRAAQARNRPRDGDRPVADPAR